MNKYIKISFLFILSILLGFIIFLLGYVYFSNQNITINNPLLPVTHFSLENAPKESLRGQISSFSGNVAWESRVSPVAILINSNIKVGQGESVVTQGNGEANINLPDNINIKMLANTDIDIIQTLPVNLVFAQTQGTAIYKSSSESIPLSISCLDLLTKLDKGKITITVNKSNNTITELISTGSATLAYTDTQNNTQVESFNSGKQITFDDNTKKVTTTALK